MRGLTELIDIEGSNPLLLIPGIKEKVNKYKEKYLDLCKELNHKAGNVILISHAHDNSEIYGTANHLLQNEKN